MVVSRLGALVAMATLVLTPAVRLACLAMCATPPAVRHAASEAAAVDRPPAAEAAAHAHHGHPPERTPPGAAPPAAAGTTATETTALETTAAATTAAAQTAPGTRCDTGSGSVCADPASVVPRPTLRAAADDVAITPLRPRLPNAASAWRPHRALPPIRVAPPGPPPASTPLRV